MQEYPPQPKQEFWQPHLESPYPPQWQPPKMQPHQPHKRSRGKFFAIGCGALVLLIIIIAAIARAGGSHPSSGTPPDTLGQLSTAVPVARIQLGPQPCPSTVQSATHWETILGTSAPQKVEGVLCGYLMGVPSLQAVVKVRYGGTAGLLDIAVFANITSTHPSRIFRLQGLPHGDVGISNYNTLLTGEIELKPSQHAGVLSTPVQQDLSTSISFSSSFQGETQEGIIALYAYSGNHVIAGAVLVKVLLSA